jgi:hypothetical protein
MLEDFVIYVVPIRVRFLDKFYLPQSIPLLELFLTRDRRLRILMDLEPDKPLETVHATKAINQLCAVLRNALREIGGHPDVQGPPWFVRQDIYAKQFVHKNGFPLSRE